MTTQPNEGQREREKQVEALARECGLLVRFVDKPTQPNEGRLWKITICDKCGQQHHDSFVTDDCKMGCGGSVVSIEVTDSNAIQERVEELTREREAETRRADDNGRDLQAAEKRIEELESEIERLKPHHLTKEDWDA